MIWTTQRETEFQCGDTEDRKNSLAPSGNLGARKSGKCVFFILSRIENFRNERKKQNASDFYRMTNYSIILVAFYACKERNETQIKVYHCMMSTSGW